MLGRGPARNSEPSHTFRQRTQRWHGYRDRRQMSLTQGNLGSLVTVNLTRASWSHTAQVAACCEAAE
jgi:hypothetical protein